MRVPPLAVAVLLLAAGCTTSRDGAAPAQPTAASPAGTSNSAGVPAPGATTAVDPTGPAGESTADASNWRVTYDWAVPSRPARVTHPVQVPISPPGPPLPILVEIRVGDHVAEGFTRITFAFHGATPSYEVSYLPAVPAEGTDDPVRLPGNAFLRIRFDQAQAHDEGGRSTIIAAPPSELGYPTLRGYAFAGDFEGYLSYGLGLRTAVGSDQALPVRLGELTRADGSRVVALDVRRG